ncbi:MAG: TIGR02757 family protein [Nitrospirota bacterium]
MSLKQTLDRFYREYNFRERILHDPIEFPHQYKRPEDIEVSGFIASCFAYGRVDLFKPVVKKILSTMGESPYDFLLDSNLKRHRRLFSGIKYRFNENNDIICLLYVLNRTLKRYKRLDVLFKLHCWNDDQNIGIGLTGLVESLLSTDTSPVYGENIKPAGFLQFFPSPKKGSACKRMNLFLRWMIRDWDIDFGIWEGIPKNKLVIPLDTHIARISKCLGFTKRSSQDWKMAVEITEALKWFDPEDPLKYDFALCHQGISKVCSKMNCKDCDFNPYAGNTRL